MVKRFSSEMNMNLNCLLVVSMYKTVVKLHSSYLPLATCILSLQTGLCLTYETAKMLNMTSSGRIEPVLLYI